MCVGMKKASLALGSSTHRQSIYINTTLLWYTLHIMWRNVSLNNDVIVIISACATNGCYRRVSSSYLTNEPKRLTFVSGACICVRVCAYVCLFRSISLFLSVVLSMCANLSLNKFSLSIPLYCHSHIKEKANASGFFHHTNTDTDTPIPYGSTTTTTTTYDDVCCRRDATHQNNNKRQVARSFETSASRKKFVVYTMCCMYSDGMYVCVSTCMHGGMCSLADLQWSAQSLGEMRSP